MMIQIFIQSSPQFQQQNKPPLWMQQQPQPQPCEEPSLDTIAEIEQHVQQNEQNFLAIQNFIENKRMQLHQLQQFLVKEFEDMELWRDTKDRIVAMCTGQVKALLGDFRALINGLVGEFRAICGKIVGEAAEKFRAKMVEKDKEIEEKNWQLHQQTRKIQKLTNQLERINLQSINKMPSLKELSREISRSKINDMNKQLSKSTFLETHGPIMKSREKDRQGTSKSPYFDRTNDRYAVGFKNLIDIDNKIVKSPTVKKIMYEVHRNIKEDYENNNKVQVEHKRYVKEKIECLKNKNSGIFTDYRPMKMDRKF